MNKEGIKDVELITKIAPLIIADDEQKTPVKKEEPPKKIMFAQTIFVTFGIAAANFIYGRLDN